MILKYTPENDTVRITALWIFLFAALLDAIDGFVARKFHQRTHFGAIIDPLADKILMISAFICLYKIGPDLAIQFPFWLVVLVIGRDIFLVAGALAIRLIKGGIDILPSVWGKLNTLFEALAVIGILLQWPASVVAWYVILLLSIGSGFDYFIKGIKQIKHRIRLS